VSRRERPQDGRFADAGLTLEEDETAVATDGGVDRPAKLTQQLAALEELHPVQRPIRASLDRGMVLGHPVSLSAALVAVQAAGMDPEPLPVAIGLHPGLAGGDRVTADGAS
jgi:hypothetical protein